MGQRSVAIGLAQVLLLVAVTPVAGVAPTTTTWTVDDDGLQCEDFDFSSIAAALDPASGVAAGDTIHVCPGVYPQPFAIDRGIVLRGDAEAVEAIACIEVPPGAPVP